MAANILRNKYSIIAIILLIGLLAFIRMDLSDGQVKDVAIEELNKAVVTAAEYDNVSPSENRLLKRFYGFNPNDYGEVVFYGPEDTMDVHEILIVKLRNEKDMTTIQKAVENRLTTQKKSFDGYGTNQTELLNNSRIIIKGNYLLFAVGENSARIADAFDKCF